MCVCKYKTVIYSIDHFVTTLHLIWCMWGITLDKVPSIATCSLTSKTSGSWRPKKKNQKTLPPRPVPTAVMPPSAGAVALWCRPTDEEYQRFQSSAYRSQVVTDGWSKWCWMMRLLMIYIYICIICTIIPNCTSVCVCVDGFCWLLTCNICCCLRDDLLMSKWRDDQLVLHEMPFLLYRPLVLWLSKLGNHHVSEYIVRNHQCRIFIAISSFCCELPEGTKYDGGA